VADLAERITVDPKQCGGRPCVRGMRVWVIDVLDLLAAGLSPDDVLRELPDLEAEVGDDVKGDGRPGSLGRGANSRRIPGARAVPDRWRCQRAATAPGR
jgi:hypothetical protein